MRYIAAAIIFGILLLVGVILFTGERPKENEETTSESVSTSQTGAPAQESDGRSFDLSGKDLKEFPEYLYDRADITSLNLSNNQLTQLPPQVSGLKSLEDFNLENNRLMSIPTQISQLENLKVLNLGNNRLESLPDELGELKNLETLDLTGYSGSTSNLAEIRSRLPNTTVKM